MSTKESKSLLFNSISWRASLLGEEVALLECGKGTPIEKIHESTYLVEQAIGGDLIDLVPAYHSIAVFSKLDMGEIIKRLDGLKGSAKQIRDNDDVIELPICYEEGLDLSRVAEQSGMNEDQVIERHLEGTYRSLFIGFTPGFIYADGLHESLACPRLEQPRTRIPSGSVGIAGEQTGIYSLASPGGWNIIGRTPTKIFDPTKDQPMLIDVGTRYRFYRITKKAFESWED
ncbi:5-oxoprolinase subunit PxpB [Ekhidna sp. MALMAid0563]|uniref:5-oxoprolinase subunit PxpB n=1 Tax=Ekhidna sp. MALMAid0563 TaxID=3143937 RepID=UPI0032E01B04